MSLLLLVLVVLPALPLLAYGGAILTGFVPALIPLPKPELPARVRAALRDVGAVETDERLLYFYSGDRWSVRSRGSALTDRRAVRYRRADDGAVRIAAIPYGAIASIVVDRPTARFRPSRVTLTADPAVDPDAVDVTLEVGQLNFADRSFLRTLERQWSAKRAARGLGAGEIVGADFDPVPDPADRSLFERLSPRRPDG